MQDYSFDLSAKLRVFDRYAAFTDLKALKEASDRSLRKSLRVNTLKSSVKEFERWAKEQGWQTQQVPWCEEGFFIDRTDRSRALGKDLLHLLGHLYMQEASSMLPPVLLDAQPGETVLDLSAAPGSKTTQIAAMLKGRGVIVANDMQEKRLGTLKSALHRLGIFNCIVTKKMGHWFGAHMVERFDRVLCDAPCTAQGTIRKDAAALTYSSDHAIGKCVGIQQSLLESAVHAAKVGGRIVYSTCTLTPEENEEVVAMILNKFSDQIIALDIRKKSVISSQCSAGFEETILDSYRVQHHLKKTSCWPLPSDHLPFLRIWPQTYDTEGFFCAVFEKQASTCDRRHEKPVRFQERPMGHRSRTELLSRIEELYGTNFFSEGDQLFEREGNILLATQSVEKFSMPVLNYTLGLPFAKLLKDGRFRLAEELVTLRGAMATKNVWEADEKTLQNLLEGKDASCSKELQGDVILRWHDLQLGLGLAQDGCLKNRLSRWVVKQFD